MKSNKLWKQLINFGIVGTIAFGVDYIIGLILMNIMLRTMGDSYFQMASVIGTIVGFTVSVIVNYYLSFLMVFKRREDMGRTAQFVSFVVLSVIGLAVDALVMWICVSPIYKNVSWLWTFDYSIVYTGAKIISTAVVMVYNFVTRKIFLENKES